MTCPHSSELPLLGILLLYQFLERDVMLLRPLPISLLATSIPVARGMRSGLNRLNLHLSLGERARVLLDGVRLGSRIVARRDSVLSILLGLFNW